MAVPLTGGEKYNVKQIIVKISEVYPNIKEITTDTSYSSSNSKLTTLYNHTLEIFQSLFSLTTTIINRTPKLLEMFNLMQEVYSYKNVCSSNKESLVKVVEGIPTLQETLIELVESDTTNRDGVLKNIMDELGIVDPNAKKKKSFW